MDNERQYNIEFKDIFKVIRKKYYILILVTIPMILLALYYSLYIMKPLYEAEIRVIIGNPLNAGGLQYQIQEVAQIQEYMKTYTALAKTTKVAENTISRLKMDIPPEKLQEFITVEPQSDTQFMDFKLAWKAPQESMEILDAFVGIFIAEAESFYPAYNINILERREEPRVFMPQSKTFYVASAFAGGLMISLLIIFVLEFFDNTLKTREDTESTLGLPVMGVIPKKRRKIKHISIKYIQNMDYLIMEAYRTLRSNIYYAAAKKDIQTLVVTSGTPGEGKTTAASLMAAAMAQDHKKTVLIDCDLRKPDIHRLFRQQPKGLANILVGGEDWKNVIQETDIDNLYIIAAGYKLSNAAENLSSELMVGLLTELMDEFEYIIIDTPPVGLVTDAQVLAQYADAYLLVVSSNKTKREDALNAKTLIQYTNATILGVLLNKIEGWPNFKYYKRYYHR